MCIRDSHEAVLKQGVYVNLDRFGLEGELFHTPTDEQRMDLIKTLSDKGYGNKILLGHDSVNVNLGRGLIMTDVYKRQILNCLHSVSSISTLMIQT